jgi:hypothetical protein
MRTECGGEYLVLRWLKWQETGVNCIRTISIVCSVHHILCYQYDELKKDEMRRECSLWGNEIYIQNFSW